MPLREKLSVFSRRGFVRFVSYAVSVVVVLSLLAIRAGNMAVRYRTQLEYSYQRGLIELSEHLDKITVTLTKGMYSGTPKGFSDYSMNLQSEAASAKTCLTQMPSSTSQLDKTYEFLSQIGNYSVSLAESVGNGLSITDEQRNNLESLLDYATEMRDSIYELMYEVGEPGAWTDEARRIVENYSGESPSALYTGLEKLEQSFTDYPTLLYDGPFSSHIIQQKARLIENVDEISKDEAEQKAEKLTGESLSYICDEQGTVPCYVFGGNNSTVSVTKAGGFLYYYLNSRPITDNMISEADALNIARKYAGSLGMGEFKDSFYSVSEGVCVVNFAYTENSVVYYTDLVKVGVALDNGDITEFNSQGYVMNHTERNFINPEKNADDAKKSISPLLTVKSAALAVVPLESREEKLCYEFLCTGQNDEQLLVYINANTLFEEDIKLLVSTDGGTLTL